MRALRKANCLKTHPVAVGLSKAFRPVRPEPVEGRGLARDFALGQAQCKLLRSGANQEVLDIPLRSLCFSLCTCELATALTNTYTNTRR